jgi:pimeloyl-ACP methyl ester carboxylesterase
VVSTKRTHSNVGRAVRRTPSQSARRARRAAAAADADHVERSRTDSTPDLHELPLKNITAPTLIISAPDDLFNTLPAAEFAAARIPGAKLVVYDTGGHLLVGRGQEARAAVRTFLADAGMTSP